MKHLRLFFAFFFALSAFATQGHNDADRTAHRNLAAPGYLTAATISASQIRLSWKDNSDKETGFDIERAPDNSGCPGAWVFIAKAGANVTVFYDKSVSANRTYWYRVRASDNHSCSPYSNPAHATTLPRPPSNLTATAVSANEINLSWRANANGETGFKIERAPDNAGSPGCWMRVAIATSTATGYNDTGLSPATTYWYRLRAYNSAGYSVYSGTASASTLCPLSVVGWGDNNEGQVTPPADLVGVTAIAAGGWHSLALKSDGTVVGWGNNYDGEATPPTNLTGVVAIAAGASHSLALKSDGTVVGWGYNGEGEATPPTNLTDVVSIAAGSRHSLALKRDGTVVGWGYDGFGVATPPTNLTAVIAIAAGAAHSLALQRDGTVVGWGYDSVGQASPPTNLTGVIAIATSSQGSSSLALKSDGTVVGWGDNRFGQAAPLTNLTGVVAIAAGDMHSLALTTIPATPSGVAAKIITSNRIHLSWTPNSTASGGFRIERVSGDSPGPEEWVQIAAVGAGTNTYDDDSVITNTTWWYRLRAQSATCGDSLFSGAVIVTVSSPAVPMYLAAGIGTSNHVDLSWEEFFGGVDGFRIERAPDLSGNPGDWAELATIAATNRPDGSGNGALLATFSDTVAATNAIYWYRVRAFNALGDSDYTAPVDVTIRPPYAPGNFSATPFANTARLSWSDYDYDAAIEGFMVERAPDAGGTPGSWTQIGTVIGSYNFSYTDTGLASNTTWWYRVRARNWVGYSDYSDPASVTIQPPAAPYGLIATIGTSNYVGLNWNEYAQDEDGFRIERAPDVNGSPGVWTEIDTIYVTNSYSIAYTDTNVTAYTTNWYRVRAFNVVGTSAYSDPATVGIVPPPIPSSFVANIIDVRRIDLTWNFDNYGGAQGYVVERAPDAGGVPGAWAQIQILSGQYNTYYGDTSIETNHTYWYRVQAYNWVGSSPYAGPLVVGIMPPPPPSNFTARALRNQVALSWLETAAGVGGFELERAPDNNGSAGDWMQLTSLGYDATSYTDYAVTVGQTYWYRIRAYNIFGDSDYSNPVSVVVDGAEIGLAVVDWNDVHQRIDGFGASSAWRSTWTTAQADMFFSTNTGIGLSFLRTRITPDGSTIEAGIARLAQARGARVWSAPWSPPAAFKSSGSVNGGIFLGGDATNRAYASQLARYVTIMRNVGINLYALSIQNEPDYNTTGYESCLWDATRFRDFIPYLHDALVASNVADVKILFPEQANWGISLAGLAMNNQTTSNQVDILAAHGYSSSARSFNRYGKALWETEDSQLSGAGAYDGSIGNGIYWARRIHSFLTVAEVNAWHYWWLISANADNEGLTDQSGNPAKRMYVLGQYSRFVRPDYYRIGVNNGSSAQISAYKDPASSRFAIVAINPNSAQAINQTFVLTNVIMNGSVVPWITSGTLSLSPQPAVDVTHSTFTFHLPPYSVVTFVGQATTGTPAVVTVPPPQLSAAIQDGVVALQINGSSGPVVTIEASTNLIDWSPVFVTNAPPMPFQWMDTNSATLPQRFYRVRISP